MQLSQLKNTADEQFKKDLTFTATMPDEEGKPYDTDVKLTVRSVRNPEVKAQVAKLLEAVEKEKVKRERAKISDADYAKSITRVGEIEKEISMLMLVKFEGIKDGDKAFPSTKPNMQMLVDTQGWLRDNIVTKATSESAFYEV